MKKIVCLLLCLLLCLSTAACTEGSRTDRAATAEEIAADRTEQITLTDEDKSEMDGVLDGYSFKGIVSLTQNGEVLYSYVAGKDKDGEALTTDSSMYLGSVSKQFCAASIVMLRDRGKLSVDDTIDKYFPDYEAGKNITIQNLLTMRAGIPDMVNDGPASALPFENTEEETIAAVREWIFAQPLLFEPGAEYAYSNSNFFLLAEIVSQITGQRYHAFVRENIFEPLGMTRSGFVEEVADAPAWAKGLARDEAYGTVIQTGLANGAGDIVSNAADMDAWMTGLTDGTLLSAGSFHEMTADYSADEVIGYGYGLEQMFRGGVGHPGSIDTYRTLDYIHEELGLHLFIASPKSAAQGYIDALPGALLKDIVPTEDE